MIRLRGAATLVAALCVSGVAVAAAPEFAALGMTPYNPPKPAPAFSLPDLDGKTVKLEDFRGKTLLLFFWATW